MLGFDALGVLALGEAPSVGGIQSGVGTATGAATVSAVGRSTAESDGTAAGTSTATADGQDANAIKQMVGTSAGTSTVVAFPGNTGFPTRLASASLGGSRRMTANTSGAPRMTARIGSR
jgi:hypothetical protein